MAEHTTIAVSRETRDRLLELGRKGDSYDDIISRILDERKGAGASVAARA